jgi:hypothetical protein
MNFSEVLKALNNAPAFELYRMRAAIDRVLDEPRWVLAVQSRLQVGQAVEYFDTRSNTLLHGQLLELRRKQAVMNSTSPCCLEIDVPLPVLHWDAQDLDEVL